MNRRAVLIAGAFAMVAALAASLALVLWLVSSWPAS